MVPALPYQMIILIYIAAFYHFSAFVFDIQDYLHHQLTQQDMLIEYHLINQSIFLFLLFNAEGGQKPQLVIFPLIN